MEIYNLLNNDLQEFVLSFVPEKTYYETGWMLDYRYENEIEDRLRFQTVLTYTREDHKFLTDILNAEFYYKKNARVLPNWT